jgi:hypothetical protein
VIALVGDLEWSINQRSELPFSLFGNPQSSSLTNAAAILLLSALGFAVHRLCVAGFFL